MSVSPPAQQETGRTIVVFDTAEHAYESLDALGLNPNMAADVDPGVLSTPGTGTVVLEDLGVAIVDEAPAEIGPAVADPRTPMISAEPEVYVYPTLTLDEWTNQVPFDVDDFVGAEDDDVDAAALWADSASSTWGIRAVQAVPPLLRTAPWSGTGIRVAVLDTGIDLGHPDFAGRIVSTASFVPGETVQDGHGHGTHVAGTVAAHRKPVGGQRRYSTAPGAQLLVGKVLSNSGSGTSGGVLAGMNWAIGQGAHVISMSLGSPVAPGQSHFTYYEAAGRAALDRSSLVVAAAGNSGDRPVGSPANCPSIMAVAALGQDLRRASFSCLGLNGNGGEINIAAPGVAVYSAWPRSKGSYQILNGTSMATPHVSGVAAILAQATGLRGRALWSRLVSTTTPLPESAQRVGRGLAKAPTRPLRIFPITPIPHGAESAIAPDDVTGGE